jgi:hypothetical protein
MLAIGVHLFVFAASERSGNAWCPGIILRALKASDEFPGLSFVLANVLAISS